MSENFKAGYKQTEVGVIPTDWCVSKLGLLGEISSGTTPSRALQNRYYDNGTTAWVKTMDLTNAEIFTTSEWVTELALNETCLKIYPPKTVLVAMYGGFQQIGRTGLLRLSATVNQALTAIQPKTCLISEFLLAILNFRIDYWKNIATSSRKDPNITGQDVRNFPIPLPPLPEQRAIAAALSEVDSLIASQDKLIAKKRDIKQGAMQELLTGKKRLPGFGGKWEEKSFDDIFERITNGSVYKPSNSFGFPITRIETISEGKVDFSRIGYARRDSELEKYLLKKHDILFSHINSIDHIGKVAIFDGTETLYHGMNLLLLRANAHHFGPFLYFFLVSEPARRVARVLAKQAVSQASINTSELKKVKISLPVLQEQHAIAKVLNEFDNEIYLLETRRDKTRELKQGMMQELLTGRIRLK